MDWGVVQANGNPSGCLVVGESTNDRQEECQVASTGRRAPVIKAQGICEPLGSPVPQKSGWRHLTMTSASKVAPREPLLVLDTGGGFYLPEHKE